MTSTDIVISPGYAVALEYINGLISKAEIDRSQNRFFALSTIQKIIGAPANSYGMAQAREITEEVLSYLYEKGRIISFEIRPRYLANGPEYGFYTIPRRYKRRSTEAVPDAGVAQASQ